MSFITKRKAKDPSKPTVDVEGFFSQKERQARKKVRAEKRQEEKAADRAAKPKREWDAMNYVLWLLGRREYSRAELEIKLARKFAEKEMPKEGIEVVLDRAIELGLQSDDRFLDSQVRMQKSAGKGPLFIRATLRQHDLNSADVESALDQPDDDWLARAYDLAERKFGPAPYAMPLRNKVFNTLLRRGFSFDQAKVVVGQSRIDALGE